MNPTSGNRLFLIDGMSNLYRAFFAVRGLSNSRGLPTNAIFGFTMMLRKLIKDHNPDYLGVVLDSKEPTHRQEKFPQYKEHRKPMPEEMVVQLPYLDRLCEALRIPIIRMAGYEADDLMGTLARQATAAGVRTVLVTSDKDLAQLVSDPDVVMLRIERSKGETKEVFLDEAGVRAKYGVGPAKIVEWLGLCGDAADGFEGGWGIGEKGAVLLLEQFGDIENALAGWEQVRRKNYREALRDSAENIRLARELAQIDLDVPVNLDLNALRMEDPDYEQAFRLFSELEFAQLREEYAKKRAGGSDGVRAAQEVVEVAPIETIYLVHETVSGIAGAIERLSLAERLAFALETGGDGRLTGIAFSDGPGRADRFPLDRGEDSEQALRGVGEILGNGLIEKVTHDWKRAMRLLTPLGIEIAGIAEDTLLEGYLLDAERGRYEPVALAVENLGLAKANASDLSLVADLTGRIAPELARRIAGDRIVFPFQQQTLEYVYREIDLPLVPLLHQIERAGFRVDTGALAALSVEMEQDLARLTQEIYREAGREFNIASPAQLGEIFEELNFEVSRRTSTGKISTGRDVLDELAVRYRLPQLVIEYRELSKLKGTYVDALPGLIDPVDGRIHTTLNQTVAATGRLSSTDPNLQNIPIRTETGRRIRRAFIPADGCVILSADYSQIELRLLAHITQDPVMLEAFRKGEDIHERTARAVFGARTPEELREKRRVAKIVNFGIAYVIGPFGLAQRVGISRHEAKQVIENYYRTYAGVKRYMDELPDQARAADCTVRSIFGRLRRLPDLKAKGAPRAGAEREAVNMPMQGSASDIVKLAMIRVGDELLRHQLNARMILQVHDELVFEVPRREVEETALVVRKAMEHAVTLDVPLPVEIGFGENWMETK